MLQINSIVFKIKHLILSFTLLGIASFSNAATWYVNLSATGTNAGTSWTNAYNTLQDAIDASSSGDEIWVAQGTYIPNVIPQFQFTSTDNRNKTFAINKNIGIYGGFDGTETARSERDYVSNVTILSGDLGTIGTVSDNSYHVIMTANLNNNAVIDGFTIQDGNANGGNVTNQYGGRNFSRELGGGIANNVSSPTLSNLIVKNSRAKYGAGISNRVSSSKLVNLIIVDNIAAEHGGGVANMASGSPKLYNCVFKGNLADDFGGGIFSESSPTIINCSFYGNRTNSSSRGGGGIYGNNSGTTTVTNCIFLGNKVGSSTSNKYADIRNGSSHTTIASYSLVQLDSVSYSSANSNALNSASNMVYNQNPLFINSSSVAGADGIWRTKDDGLRLKGTSPAVDVGLNSAISAYSTDVLGTTRTVNTTVNMGAYEFLACQKGNSLPTAASTYTATYADVDGSFSCFCDDNSNFILGLDLTGSAAVVPASGVSLEIGATITTTYNSAGGIITNSNGGVIFNRKWNVSPTSQPGTDVTVLYPFTNTEYSAIVTALSSKSTTITNANQLQMYKLTSSGTFADPHASGAIGPVLTHGTIPSTVNWVYSAHSNGTDHLATYKVSSFSGGGGGGGASGIALPLELVSFEARAAAMHTANIQWNTAREINNSHFEIERSYDGRAFEMIGQVASKGNSHQQMEYNYIDNGIHPSNNIAYYRLKQIDFNGTSEYSTTQFVRFNELGSEIYFSAYPNPTSIELNIKIESNLLGSPFRIINALGQEIKQGELSNLNSTIDVSKLPKGSYIMLIGDANYSHSFLVE